MNIRSVVRSALVLLLAPLAAACYQSTLPLGPPERGTIDRGAGRHLDVRRSEGRDEPRRRHLGPLDAHRYAIEWREEPDHVTRYRAYATRVGKEVLLNVEEVDATPDRSAVRVPPRPPGPRRRAVDRRSSRRTR